MDYFICVFMLLNGVIGLAFYLYFKILQKADFEEAIRDKEYSAPIYVFFCLPVLVLLVVGPIIFLRMSLNKKNTHLNSKIFYFKGRTVPYHNIAGT